MTPDASLHPSRLADRPPRPRRLAPASSVSGRLSHRPPAFHPHGSPHGRGADLIQVLLVPGKARWLQPQNTARISHSATSPDHPCITQQTPTGFPAASPPSVLHAAAKGSPTALAGDVGPPLTAPRCLAGPPAPGCPPSACPAFHVALSTSRWTNLILYPLFAFFLSSRPRPLVR